MIHPLFRLIITKPQVLVEHVEAYSDLVGEEVNAVADEWRRKAVLTGIALGASGVAVMLIGMSLLLWAALPTEQMPAPWALIVIPAVPTLVALYCVTSARGAPATRAFADLREQFAADAALLRAAGEARR